MRFEKDEEDGTNVMRSTVFSERMGVGLATLPSAHYLTGTRGGLCEEGRNLHLLFSAKVEMTCPDLGDICRFLNANAPKHQLAAYAMKKSKWWWGWFHDEICFRKFPSIARDEGHEMTFISRWTDWMDYRQEQHLIIENWQTGGEEYHSSRILTLATLRKIRASIGCTFVLKISISSCVALLSHQECITRSLNFSSSKKQNLLYVYRPEIWCTFAAWNISWCDSAASKFVLHPSRANIFDGSSPYDALGILDIESFHNSFLQEGRNSPAPC